MKTGLFVEHTTRPAQRSSQFNGNLSFNTDGQNPLNTNVGFANALLGAVTQYPESDGHPSAHGQFMNTEFYVQDNWRVKRNLTIDAGVRFYYITPTQSEGDQVAQFGPNVWNAAQAPQPVPADLDGAGPPRAVNPLTGEILPARLHRPPGAGLRQLHQRHGGLRGHAAAEVAVQGRAAHRVRLGRDGRRQDRRPRRRRRVLRPLLGRQHPRPHRAAAGPQHLHDQLHDDSPSCSTAR